ncbi:hypothetical protein EJ04DRAFT_466119 [Polyplosphaeria fusca]|uniref:NYN domain-containing protein n=1 Tax=Polyplosphaeria fusca TaxID=682080 RepID=A0A9P4V1N6_9PLEO|nr:hypothetical protein EJ04DRAFT_466119 [Polyplosphaeria fusca]
MPDPPIESPWDLGPALRILERSETHLLAPQSSSDYEDSNLEGHVKSHDNIENTSSLGNFRQLWELLGMPLDRPPRADPIRTIDGGASSSDETPRLLTPSEGNPGNNATHHVQEPEVQSLSLHNLSSEEALEYDSSLRESKDKTLSLDAGANAQDLKKADAKAKKKLNKAQRAKKKREQRAAELEEKQRKEKGKSNNNSEQHNSLQPISSPRPHTPVTPVTPGTPPVVFAENALGTPTTPVTILRRPSGYQFSSVKASKELARYTVASSQSQSHSPPKNAIALANLQSSLQQRYAAPQTTSSHPFHVSSAIGLSTGAQPTLEGHDDTVAKVHQPVVLRNTNPPVSTRFLSQLPEDRHLFYFERLMRDFPSEKKWLVAPMQLLNSKNTTGIHVFVDASNILFGFRFQLQNLRVPMYDLSFDSLALLLERRRPVARRILAGGRRADAPLDYINQFIEKAEAVGYENNIYELVRKHRELSERQKFFKDAERFGWNKATAMQSSENSDPETGSSTRASPSKQALKWVEQGVDENLHLKMCQSVLDCDEPSTMVVATGDGNMAEYSDGFLANVERALKKGWNVELVSWKAQTNAAYMKKQFATKWEGRFKIIYLDPYLESLIEA